MTSQESEQYRQFIQRLQREEFRPAALNDIKNFLAYKAGRETVAAIRDVGIANIVQCLNLKDKVQFDLTCEVLSLCFEKFEVGEVVRNFTGHIMYLLRHEKSCVRKLAVDEVYKTVSRDVNLLPIPQYIDVFVAVAQLVSDQDVGVANKAILITSNLPQEAYPKVLDEMKIALEYSNSSKCNAFEVIINISLKSYELLRLSAENGYIDFMLVELHTDDILYQMNILELLSRLAVIPHGIGFLVKNGALQRISELVVDMKNNPLKNLLLPGYLKFFGCIAHHYPKEVFDKYPILLDMLFDTFELGDQTLLPVALDTLSFVGTTIEGKLCLAAIGSKYTQLLTKVGEMIKHGVTEIKVRALHCFAGLIGVDKDPKAPKTGPIDHRVTLMTREWFRSISSQPEAMEVLFGICKNPFPDIRLAAFALLDAVCQHQWGEELVARTAGFVEYLLDRTVDHTKESKEQKYDVIKKLSRSVAFEQSTITKLQTYVDQGPFYSEPMMQVAMEED